MDKVIREFAESLFDIEIKKEYHFKKMYGFTFAFESEFCIINNNVTSASISPVGIIYEENGQYYLAPLSVVDEIDEVVKEFVQKEII